MQKIPFYKPCIGVEEIEEVVDTLKSGWLTTGPKTKQFEREFAAYVRHPHGIAVNSCTAALHLALEAIGLKPGDGVIVPTMTFAATAEVVRYLGGRPILVDCRERDFNLDVHDAERKIAAAHSAGQKVAAIMPVHYAGQIGDVAGVRDLASRHNLKIVEDAAHCCPAYYREDNPQSAREAHQSKEMSPSALAASLAGAGWKTVGTGADISCFSFYANKTITTGEGGMACTANEEYADRMRVMSLHGISRDAWKRYTGEGSWYYEILAPGFKYNLTDIASSIGLHQLRKSDQFHKVRTELAGLYTELLKDTQEIILPQTQPNRIHSWHLYAIRIDTAQLNIDRAQIISELQTRGVNTSVHWMPLHMHPYYRQTYGYVPEDLPVANAIYPGIITLPLYPGLEESQVSYVCDSIKAILAANRRVIAHLGQTPSTH